jgi:VWFA-related protein
MKNTILAAALVVLALPLAGQQQPAAPAGETIEVSVTNLDVVVTDNKGNRVSGLTKDDFEVLENGVKRPITNLSEIGKTVTSATETMQAQPRRILLVVDNGSIALPARRKVFDATRKTLDQLLIGSADRIAIATISRSIQQRLGWTNDKKEILRVLDEIERDAILPRADLIEFERALNNIINDADVAAAGGASGGGTSVTIPGVPGGGGDPTNPGGGTGGGGSTTVSTGGGRRSAPPPVEFQQVVTRGRNYAQILSNETKQTLAGLNAALTAFAGAPGGRKLLIIAGGALPLNAGDAIFQRIESVRQQMEMSGHAGFKNTRSSSPLGQTPGFDLTKLIDTVAANARLKGVAIYAVNPEFGDRQLAGVQSRSVSDNTAEFASMSAQLNGYNKLASGTGGAAMIGAPAEVAITQIRTDLESYYSLGYRSSGPIDPKTTITVKVKNGLRARSSIASGSVDRNWEVADQVLANHLVEPANPLGISIVADPAVMDGDKKTIPIKVLIPVDSLKMVKVGGEYKAGFAVFVSMGDPTGNGSEPNRQEQSFSWPEDVLPQIKGKTIGFAVNVAVDADRDRISVGVLDQNSGAAGFSRISLN